MDAIEMLERAAARWCPLSGARFGIGKSARLADVGCGRWS
jgi:hypothetical protein